jgi:N-acetylmuramoyl-L-alanine amidase
MKKMNKLVIASTIAFSALFTMNISNAEAASTHTVKSGESFWIIANNYGVSVESLKNVNNKTSNLIYPGQQLVIPASISAADRDLLARLVYAEAKGESYAGKVAVATVVLNRVDHPDFPDTVKGVIYEQISGHYAFTPVQNGAINQTADAESKRAVNEALAFRGKGQGSIYFYNPRTAKSDWILSREVTITIGNHRFAK